VTPTIQPLVPELRGVQVRPLSCELMIAPPLPTATRLLPLAASDQSRLPPSRRLRRERFVSAGAAIASVAGAEVTLLPLALVTVTV
jgi:hypothetical protein